MTKEICSRGKVARTKDPSLQRKEILLKAKLDGVTAELEAKQSILRVWRQTWEAGTLNIK